MEGSAISHRRKHNTLLRKGWKVAVSRYDESIVFAPNGVRGEFCDASEPTGPGGIRFVVKKRYGDFEPSAEQFRPVALSQC